VATLQEVLKEEQSAIRFAAYVGNPNPSASHSSVDCALNERTAFLKSKAVGVASAIRSGSVTATMVRSLLQEDIPDFVHGSSLSGTDDICTDEGLADLLKTGSALALIKAMGYLIDEDPMPAGEAVDEYLDLRRRAEQANLGSAIIGLPKVPMVIDEYARYLACELTGMVTLHSIEDPIKRHRALLRLLRNQWPKETTAEEIIREQRDRC
jgi:hypothetical protein